MAKEEKEEKEEKAKEETMDGQDWAAKKDKAYRAKIAKGSK